MNFKALTSGTNYFEDFIVGEAIRHARSKTLEVLEQVLITNMVMNTASGHFDKEMMRTHPVGERIGFGGVTIALCLGLASQDTGENALREVGLDNIRLPAPVVHGDTLTAFSEVLDTSPSNRPDTGIVRFKHLGTNQNGVIVFEAERTVELKRKQFWGSQ